MAAAAIGTITLLIAVFIMREDVAVLLKARGVRRDERGDGYGDGQLRMLPCSVLL